MIQLEGYKVSRTQTLEDYTSDLGTAVNAVAEQAWIENPTSSIARLEELSQATKTDKERSYRQGGILSGVGYSASGPLDDTLDSPVLSKQDADTRVNEAGVSLKIGEKGIPERALSILIDRKREEVKRRALIDSAPEGFWSGAATIGTGLAVSLADPINVASAFVPVIGEARYAKMIASASSAAGRAGVRAGVGAVEGAVGAAIVEPLILGAAAAEQSEYGLYDSFLNLTFGAVLGGGLHTGLGAIGDVIAKSSPTAKQDMLKSAVAQAMDDRPIDVGYIAKLDDSFRSEWRSNQVARAIEGADVDARIAKEFNNVMDDIQPELITRASKELSEADAAKAISDIEAGRVPEVFIEDVAVAVKSRIQDFEAPAPKVDSVSPQASPVDSMRASDTIKDYAEYEPVRIDAETDEILIGLEDLGEDVAPIRAEIDEINRTAEIDEKGLREAVMCMMGK